MLDPGPWRRLLGIPGVTRPLFPTTNRGGIADAQTVALVVGKLVVVMVGCSCGACVGLGDGKAVRTIMLCGVGVGGFDSITPMPPKPPSSVEKPEIVGVGVMNAFAVNVGVPYG